MQGWTDSKFTAVGSSIITFRFHRLLNLGHRRQHKQKDAHLRPLHGLASGTAIRVASGAADVTRRLSCPKAKRDKDKPLHTLLVSYYRPANSHRSHGEDPGRSAYCQCYRAGGGAILSEEGL